ncbi:hypothetical protein Cob_v005442 [Colletotrichum orbiculare MAFF 240422]|uniref:Uncharacterized protein n=1 Tax=Colletotrichum orbiculare (strain 104-T / ATCC 96160 / CBS 514.97 / LARS 414 / MAFF 240422) TaxID=1213857 RepID=A0A484FVF0_COLOR|nr:hypothetical protein Cob_v005442 [Colletotrichum orbiculare MAFF 240422]
MVQDPSRILVRSGLTRAFVACNPSNKTKHLFGHGGFGMRGLEDKQAKHWSISTLQPIHCQCTTRRISRVDHSTSPRFKHIVSLGVSLDTSLSALDL